MLPADTSILLTETKMIGSMLCRYRLIQSFDGVTEREIYSLFVTTEADLIDEAFAFDIADSQQTALYLFYDLIAAETTACTLRETVYALLTKE